MKIRLVMLGDIVGTPGVQAVMLAMPKIREEYRPDLVLANAENAANGSGLTANLYKKLCDAGVHGMTLGDHVYRKKQIVTTLESADNLIRPLNLPAGAKGKTWMRLEVPTEGGHGNGPRVYVMTVLGRVFMSALPVDEPFAAVDRVLASLPEKNPIVILEVHAEATSEKIALARYFDGRVAAVLGTHTHVPTADARVLPKGTATITDLGMSGPYDSVLGRDVSAVVKHMTTGMPEPFDVATDDVRVCGVVVEIETTTGKAVSIERVELAGEWLKGR